MKRSILLQTLGVAGLLVALPALSLLADDLHTPSHPPATYVWGAGTPATSVPAGNPTAGLTPRNTSGITYLTGGIGNEEREAMEAVKNNYDLHIITTDSSGNFESDNHLIIRDPSGKQLLDVSTGPIFYVELPHGSYSVEISNASVDRKETVTVGGAKPLSIYFRE